MARDRNTELSMAELLDALERGHRLFKGFEYGLDVARRVANLEGAERDLMKRVEESTALCVSVERDCDARKSRAIADLSEYTGKAEAVIADAKRQASIILADATTAAKQEVDAARLASMKEMALVESRREEVKAIRQDIDAAKADLAKLGKQIADARAAKKALLEA